MSWDWDKLKQQQQSRGGGAPPQMDESLDRFKKFKLPGGPLVIVLIAIIMVAATTFYTVKQDEVVCGRDGVDHSVDAALATEPRDPP